MRRKKQLEAQTHTRKSDGKTWLQRGLGVSRVMQTFRDLSVREAALRDEESIPYLLRKHYTLFESGFTTVGEAAEAAQRVQESIYERMREGRELA